MRRDADRTVLVAGGAGFIGSHLCEAMLVEGAHVICLDNLLTGRLQNIRHLRSEPRFDFVQADVIDRLPRLPRVDAVLNLACAASPPRYQADPVHTLMTSVVGTRNLLDLAQQHRARFLLASTSEVYGDPLVHPQTEAYLGNVNPTGPRACYDEGKRAAETLCFDYQRLGRADVRVARIFNTYGPRMSPDDGRVVSNVVNQALSGTPITLYGDGRQTRSFCYVDDLVGGLLRLLSHPGRLTAPVNLGNPTEITVATLVDMVVRMSRSASPVVRQPLPVDDPRRRCPDITQARQLLGWEPSVPLEQGLRRTITWFAAEQGIRPHLVQVSPPARPRAARQRAAAGD